MLLINWDGHWSVTPTPHISHTPHPSPTHTHTHTHTYTNCYREEAKLIAKQRGEDGPLVVKYYNDPQIRTVRMKHQRSATFPLPAVFSKLPPSVASFMLPSANEALLIGEGLKVFVLVLPDGSTCCKYPSPPFSPLLSPSSFPSPFCSPFFSSLPLPLPLPPSAPLSLPLLFLPFSLLLPSPLPSVLLSSPLSLSLSLSLLLPPSPFLSYSPPSLPTYLHISLSPVPSSYLLPSFFHFTSLPLFLSSFLLFLLSNPSSLRTSLPFLPFSCLPPSLPSLPSPHLSQFSPPASFPSLP